MIQSCVPSSQNRGPTTQAPVVVDHAETADESDARVGHGSTEGRAGDLAQRLGHSQIASRGTRLPHRELAARGVDRKVATRGERVTANEVRPFPFGAKAQVLDLHDA